jgi:hypothetical protein
MMMVDCACVLLTRRLQLNCAFFFSELVGSPYLFCSSPQRSDLCLELRFDLFTLLLTPPEHQP